MKIGYSGGDVLPDIQEIKVQMGRLDGVIWPRIGRLVKELPEILGEDEKVKRWISGFVRGILGGNGLLVATEDRLIFVAEKLVGIRKDLSPYTDITSVHFKKGICRGDIKVFTSRRRWELEGIDNNMGSNFFEYVKSVNIDVETVKDSKDFQSVIKALNSEEEELRIKTVSGLKELGETAVEPLIQTLKYNDNDERKGAAEALGDIGGYGVAILRGGLVKFVNKKLLEINGFREYELLEKVFTDFVSPKYREPLLEMYKKRIAGLKVPSRYETEILSKQGNIIHVEINAALIEYQERPADLVLLKQITHDNN